MVKYCFRNAPVNLLFDILYIVLLIIGFVISVVLAYNMVNKIKETLKIRKTAENSAVYSIIEGREEGTKVKNR